jgi:DNA polymerase-1
MICPFGASLKFPDGREIDIREAVNINFHTGPQVGQSDYSGDQPIRTLLVDGDVIAYTIACRIEEHVDWDGNGNAQVFSDSGRAFEQTQWWLESIQAEHKADKVIVALSDKSRRYFRHDIFPAYKAHRTHGTPPQSLGAVKDFLRKGVNDFEPVFFPTLEADDVLGILATSTHVDYGERIIVTSDKDLLQIPGKHYNPRNGKSATVTESAGDYFFLTQVLTGDPTDGFPGIKGVGPKKAEKILLEAFSKGGVSLAWSAIVSAYERAGRRRATLSRWLASLASSASPTSTPRPTRCSFGYLPLPRHRMYLCRPRSRDLLLPTLRQLTGAT